MGFLSGLFGSSAQASGIRDADKLLRAYRAYGPVERGHLHASVKIALASLLLDCDADEAGTIFLALEAMDSGRELTPQELGRLALYDQRLLDLERQSHRSTGPISGVVAAGMPLWVTSNRALASAALQPYARELWRLVDSGDRDASFELVEGALMHLGRDPLADKILEVRELTVPTAFRLR
jgi:hypothetical protein